MTTISKIIHDQPAHTSVTPNQTLQIHKFFQKFDGLPPVYSMMRHFELYPIIPLEPYQSLSKHQTLTNKHCFSLKRLYINSFQYLTPIDLVYKIAHICKFMHVLTWNHELVHQMALTTFKSRNVLNQFKVETTVSLRRYKSKTATGKFLGVQKDKQDCKRDLIPVESIDFLRRAVFFTATMRTCIGCQRMWLGKDCEQELLLCSLIQAPICRECAYSNPEFNLLSEEEACKRLQLTKDIFGSLKLRCFVKEIQVKKRAQKFQIKKVQAGQSIQTKRGQKVAAVNRIKIYYLFQIEKALADWAKGPQHSSKLKYLVKAKRMLYKMQLKYPGVQMPDLGQVLGSVKDGVKMGQIEKCLGLKEKQKDIDKQVKQSQRNGSKVKQKRSKRGFGVKVKMMEGLGSHMSDTDFLNQ